MSKKIFSTCRNLVYNSQKQFVTFNHQFTLSLYIILMF